METCILVVLIGLAASIEAQADFFVPPVVTKPHPRFIITSEVRQGYARFVSLGSGNNQPLSDWLSYFCAPFTCFDSLYSFCVVVPFLSLARSLVLLLFPQVSLLPVNPSFLKTKYLSHISPRFVILA